MQTIPQHQEYQPVTNDQKSKTLCATKPNEMDNASLRKLSPIGQLEIWETEPVPVSFYSPLLPR